MKLSKSVLIIMILTSLLILFFRYNYLIENNEENLIRLNELYAERVRTSVMQAADVTEVLDSLLVASKGNMLDDEIATMLELAYNQDIHIAIAYMPDGIITKVYPIQGNEASLQYNVFEDEQASFDALMAMETKEIAFSGPYMLMIGTPGLVARNPVYYVENGEDVFWGFIAAIIRPNVDLLQSTGLENLHSLNYEYSVQSNYNDIHVDLYSSTNFNNDFATVTHYFQIGESTWQIEIYQNDSINLIITEVSLLALFLFAFTGLLFFAFHKVEKKHNLIHLQALTDPLTNLNNRRALDKYEEKSNRRKSSSGGYTIFYIDLNKFKPVNDEFGHEIGDKLLSIFSERLISQFRLDTFISRVGGDEFVIVFPTNQDETQCKQVENRLLKVAEDAFFIEGHEIHISCSIGSASYPKDGENFAEVLARADKQMFLFKESHRKNIER